MWNAKLTIILFMILVIVLRFICERRVKVSKVKSKSIKIVVSNE